MYDDPDCNGECCSGQTSAPFQPDIDYSTVKRHKENKAASYKWLSFCTTRNVVFCYYCHTMTSQGKLTLSKYVMRHSAQGDMTTGKKSHREI